MQVIIDFFSDHKVQEMVAAVSTQIIAFIVFLWIMKKYAWKPIIRILDERREQIKGKFEHIEKLEKKHIEIKENYQEKLKTVDHVVNLRIQEGIDEGRRLSQEMIRQARKEAEKIINNGREHLKLEVDNVRKQLRGDVTRIVLKATEKLMSSQMDLDKHKELVSSFIEEVDRKK